MQALKALFPYLRRYQLSIALGLVSVLVANLLSVGSTEAVKHALDAMARAGATRGEVGRWAAASAGLAVLAGAGRFWMRQNLNSVSRWVELDLRDDFFAHLLRLDAPFYNGTPTGEVMSRATNDLQAVRMVAGPAYMYLVNTIVFGLMAITRMVLIDPWMTVLALIPMLLLPPVTTFFGKLIHDQSEGIQAQLGIISTMAQENLAGQRIVKAYGQEAAQSARFTELARESMRLNVRLARTSGLFYPSLTLLAGLAMALALGLGGRAILAGRITVGDFVIFLLYLGQLSFPMIALGWVVSLFQRGAASMGRVSQILETRPVIADAPDARGPEQVRGEIEFRDVWFRYPGTERDVLRGVSFRAPAGSTVALVGPTGSGKSTVVSLLARLYDPTRGEVRVDGVAVREWPMAQLRSAVALVPQDTFLFSATIGENLALGFDEADPERRLQRVRGAARVAQLEQTVAELPGGYETVLGERGINLSGGQKQRAALARAVARDAPMLVLDDALSAVDTQTEHEILGGLRGVFAGRTSVIVSHRVAAVMDADLILVLDDGELVERGTHAELLRAGGVYAALQRRQLLEAQVQGDDLLAGASGAV
ncbi:MAG TPA: ABC transporter ATP-binding protein [Longimicrobium sp.]|jgi:ATP-binding cassette subfamily B protein|uniref:ABC transporter ATP-binding protein n=1 Tax=Longimicrobium sp. TaxID=2029185 RepID=UPI002ED8AC5A